MPVGKGLPSSRREKFRSWARADCGLWKRMCTLPVGTSEAGVKVNVKDFQSLPIL